MKRITQVRIPKVSQRKLQERSAILFSRALERWNVRNPIIR